MSAAILLQREAARLAAEAVDDTLQSDKRRVPVWPVRHDVFDAAFTFEATAPQATSGDILTRT
jgi:hypothetical protein